MEFSDDLLNLLFDATSDGIYIVDPDRRITAWNAASERITGYSRDKMIGQLCQSNLLMHCDDSGRQLCKEGCPLASTLLDGQAREAQVYLHHISGHRLPVSIRVYPIHTGNAVTGAIEIFNENISLTHARARIEELEKSVMLDPLTGLANRRMGQLRMDLAFEEWRSRQAPFGILMIDIDHFKQVNDQHGHPVGDQVLCMVAASLSSGVRVHDIVSRWGGEEFLVILPQTGLEELAVIAERLRMLVEASVIFPDHQDRRDETGVRVKISIGAAKAQAGDNLTSMVERADLNLYKSKTTGRNRLTI